MLSPIVRSFTWQLLGAKKRFVKSARRNRETVARIRLQLRFARVPFCAFAFAVQQGKRSLVLRRAVQNVLQMSDKFLKNGRARRVARRGNDEIQRARSLRAACAECLVK